MFESCVCRQGEPIEAQIDNPASLSTEKPLASANAPPVAKEQTTTPQNRRMVIVDFMACIVSPAAGFQNPVCG